MYLSACGLLILAAGHALGAEILVVHPLPVFSHTVAFKPIFKELARRGHNVTIITAFIEESVPQRYHQIDIGMDFNKIKEELYTESPDDLNGWTYQLGGMWFFCRLFSPIILRYLKPVLPSKSNSYDLVVIEPFFCQEFILGLSHYYKAPIVATLPQPLTPAIAAAVGNPDIPSYIPNIRLGMTADMSFLQRAYNTWLSVIEQVGTYIYHLPHQDRLMRELLDDEPAIPYLSDHFKNISLILSLTHFSMNYPRPVMKNILEVGGINLHLDTTLPQDLEKFMNESAEGVVYFSWGSHFQDSDSQYSLPALMEVFSQLKQRVVFKWHNTTVPNNPDNVLVKTWVPQTAILGHKNLRLFISHCGLNSVYEAAYHGVPIVGTPQFGDQPHNTRLLEYYGMGVTVHKEQITDGHTLLAAINKVLHDPSFRAAAERRREMLRDRSQPVEQEAAYWIEYVIKYGGEALRPVSAVMPWYSLALIDLYACLFGIVLLLTAGVAACISPSLRKATSTTVDTKKNYI